MSTYLYRYIEVRKPVLKGSVQNENKLPDSNVMVGDTYRIYSSYGYRRCVAIEDGVIKWVEIDRPEYIWLPCTWYSDTKEDGNSSLGESVHKRVFVDPVTHEVKTLYRHLYFCNNGGAMRDRYIGDTWHDYSIQKRGLPHDVSKEVNDDIKRETYAYNKTYATLSELSTILDKDMEKFRAKLMENVMSQHLLSIDQKIDVIMEKVCGVKPEKTKKPDDEECEDYEDNIDYLFNEELQEITCLSDEIAYISRIAEDAMNVYDYEDIRVVYYMA